MIDPVDLGLIKNFGQFSVDGAAGRAVMAKRLFNHKACLRGDKTGRFQHARCRAKQAGCNGKIKDDWPFGGTAFTHKFGQCGAAITRGDIQRNHRDDRQKRVPGVFIGPPAGEGIVAERAQLTSIFGQRDIMP